MISTAHITASTATTAITGRSGSDSLGRSTSVDGCPGWRSISDRSAGSGRLDLGRLTTGEHPLHVQLGGAPLNRVGERVLDVRPVHEAVRRHLVQRVRFGEELEHRLVASVDDRPERIEEPEELRLPLDDPLVMERHVVIGFLVAHLGQTRLEVVEVAPDVAVVRPETRQVDVGQEEHATRDAEAAVAAGVPGEMDRLHRRATEVEDVTVGKTDRIRARCIVELLDDLGRERVCRRQAVHGHQAVEAPRRAGRRGGCALLRGETCRCPRGGPRGCGC